MLVKFIVQRVLGMIVTLFAVSVVIFIVIELPPGDFAERYAHEKLALAGQPVTEADIQNFRAQFGLDRPFEERYTNWIGGIVLRGDFGTSFVRCAGWVLELLTFKVPPPPLMPPKRRSRPPKQVLMEAAA